MIQTQWMVKDCFCRINFLGPLKKTNWFLCTMSNRLSMLGKLHTRVVYKANPMHLLKTDADKIIMYKTFLYCIIYFSIHSCIYNLYNTMLREGTWKQPLIWINFFFNLKAIEGFKQPLIPVIRFLSYRTFKRLRHWIE